jgi:transposase
LAYELSGKTLVYLDESGFSQDNHRPNGYAPIGQRCYSPYDWGNKKRTNAIGAIKNFKLITVSLFDGSINSDVFYTWIKKDLLPKLSGDEVIVMDNATFHKRADILAEIKNKGCILEFLPPYSPDLNPIEKKWAQAKSIRKKYDCSIESLFIQHVV